MAARIHQGALQVWGSIPGIVAELVGGFSEEELDSRKGGAPMSIRETVHHIAEANPVAASIVVAAPGESGLRLRLVAD